MAKLPNASPLSRIKGISHSVKLREWEKQFVRKRKQGITEVTEHLHKQAQSAEAVRDIPLEDV